MSKTTLTNALNTEIAKFLKSVSVQFKIPLDKLEKLWNSKSDESEDSTVSEVKKTLDDESVSDMKPLKGGKKPVDSDDDSLPAAKKGGKKTDSPAKKGGKKAVDSDDDSLPPAKKGGKKTVDSDDDSLPPAKKGGKKAVDSDDDSLPPAKKGGKKAVDSDDDSLPPAKKGGKKAVDSDDDSLPPAKKGGKKAVDSDDDSLPPAKKGGKKAVDSDDDSLPAAKKREVGKKTTKMVYEESDKPKDNSNLLPEDSDMKFLKGTNYILHKGVVVAGFSKNGVIPLMHAHIKSLESDAYADIKHEKLDKARLNKIFKCDALNQSIKSEKPPVKRNKK